MTPEERIEAVAQAIYAEAQNGEYVGWRRDWPNVTLDGWFDLKGFARSAILATLQSLLEPTGAMVSAAHEQAVSTFECCFRVSPENALAVYLDAIQAAIKEHSK